MIPNMESNGTLQPTDIGTSTVETDLKEDSKRRNMRWDYEEVKCMLKLIKEHSFVKNSYSLNKMSNLLSILLAKKGWNRTDKQVHLKLSSLRKSFLAYERLRLVGTDVKECQFYKELRDVYKDTEDANGCMDFDDDSSNSDQDRLLTFPNDKTCWTKQEVQKMLDYSKFLGLTNELTLTVFSPVAIRMIAEGLQSAGYKRSTEQVKNVFCNLRSMYIDYKMSLDNSESPAEIMFYSYLDYFWGKEYKKWKSKDKRRILNRDDSWSNEETIILLTVIQDLNIANDAYNEAEKIAEELRQSLAENGYSRSKEQIVERLENLKKEFMDVSLIPNESEAIIKFPFYKLYKKLFEHQFGDELAIRLSESVELPKDSLDYIDFYSKLDTLSSMEGDFTGLSWTKSEIKLLLKTIQELNSKQTQPISDNFECENVDKLQSALQDGGFYRSQEEIQNQLTQLKIAYFKCNLEDSSEKDVFDCPFYNELHDIYQLPISNERYEFIQNLLPSVEEDLKISDHSYTNIKFNDSALNGSLTNEKVKVLPNDKSLDTWFPVHNIDNKILMSSPIKNKFPDMIDDIFNSDISMDGLREAYGKDDSTCTDKLDPNLILGDQSVFHQINGNGPTEADLSEFFTFSNEINDSLAAEPPNKKRKVDEESVKSSNSTEERTCKTKVLLRPVDANQTNVNVTNSKFVRLIVPNDKKNNKNDHIMAHIEPINSASSVCSGKSTPIDHNDFKVATDRGLLYEDLNLKSNGDKDFGKKNINEIQANDNSICKTIREAVNTLMQHRELMQQQHQLWIEKQFEIQRQKDEANKTMILNELKEMKSIFSVFLNNTKPKS